MHTRFESDGQWNVSLSWGDRRLLAVQIDHGVGLQGHRTDQRGQRALRSRLMIELALAWTDPVQRQRMRAAGE